MTGWEPLWVLGIEGIGYCLSILEPSFGQLKLANGTSIAWLRYSGWMVTCPVLLMFLTAMTTYGGNKPPVRLVPLLIANQVMIIAGITAAAYDGVAKWVMFMLSIGCGGIVFTLSSLCLHSLYKLASTDKSSHWGRLKIALEVSGDGDNTADGAAAGHTSAARHEAMLKLVTNHAKGIRDVTRPDGPPVSQPNLKRMPRQFEAVDTVLFEVARRLLGRRYGDSRRVYGHGHGHGYGHPGTEAEALLWASAAQFVSARLQTSAAQVAKCRGHEGRKADMSPAAGAAMRAVLDEVSRAEVAKQPLANRLNGGFSRQRGWAWYLTGLMSASFVVGWFLFPLAWTLGPPGMGAIGIDVQESLYATGDVLAKNCFACLGVIIKFCYLRHLNAPVQDVGTSKPGADATPPPPSQAASLGNRRSARRASSIMMEEFNPGGRKGSKDPSFKSVSGEDENYLSGADASFQTVAASPSSCLRSPRASKQSMGLDVGDGTPPRKPTALSAVEAASMSTEALVQRASAVLEPLCGRLCVRVRDGGRNNDGGVEGEAAQGQGEIDAEISRMRQLCAAVLQLTDGEGGAGEAGEPAAAARAK